jgi:glycosyltransferase involved in cell wall biosynthesis
MAPVESYRVAEFWREVGIDAAIMFTWLGYSQELKALREAGVKVVNRADSDGAYDFRLFARDKYRQIVAPIKAPVSRLRMLKAWLHSYFIQHRPILDALIASAENSDVIAIETGTARDRLIRTFRQCHRADLIERIIVSPHLIAPDILSVPLPERKSKKIIAIGRWNAHQKNAPLLYAALNGFLARHPDSQITIIGIGGEEAFHGLRNNHKMATIVCTGAIPRDAMKSMIADSRILILSSRYESFHIAAHEALCLGATVVGPPVIPLPDICGAGNYGTMAPTFHSVDLMNALECETAKWDSNIRDPAHISSFWRDRLDTVKVVHKMIALLQESKPVTLGPVRNN